MQRNEETYVGNSVSVLREIAHGLEEILTTSAVRIDRVDVLNVVSLGVFTVPHLENLLAIFVYVYKIVNILMATWLLTHLLFFTMLLLRTFPFGAVIIALETFLTSLTMQQLQVVKDSSALQ